MILVFINYVQELFLPSYGSLCRLRYSNLDIVILKQLHMSFKRRLPHV